MRRCIAQHYGIACVSAATESTIATCLPLASGSHECISHAFPLLHQNSKHTFFDRPQVRQEYPLNLSISIRGGKETNEDSLSSGERSGKSPSFGISSAQDGLHPWAGASCSVCGLAVLCFGRENPVAGRRGMLVWLHSYASAPWPCID